MKVESDELKDLLVNEYFCVGYKENEIKQNKNINENDSHDGTSASWTVHDDLSCWTEQVRTHLCKLFSSHLYLSFVCLVLHLQLLLPLILYHPHLHHTDCCQKQ